MNFPCSQRFSFTPDFTLSRPLPHLTPSREWKHSSVSWFSQICLLSCCCCYLLLAPLQWLFLCRTPEEFSSLFSFLGLLFFHSFSLRTPCTHRQVRTWSWFQWKKEKAKRVLWNCSINGVESSYLCELSLLDRFEKESLANNTTEFVTTAARRRCSLHDQSRCVVRFLFYLASEKTCWAFSFSYYVHEASRSCMNETERVRLSVFPST